MSNAGGRKLANQDVDLDFDLSIVFNPGGLFSSPEAYLYSMVLILKTTNPCDIHRMDCKISKMGPTK